MQTPNDVAYHHRADLIAARDMLTRQASGHDADLTTAALLLVRTSVKSAHIRDHFTTYIHDARHAIATGDVTAAVREIDLILDETCPHHPATWYAIDTDDGVLVRCPGCQVSWLSDGAGIPRRP